MSTPTSFQPTRRGDKGLPGNAGKFAHPDRPDAGLSLPGGQPRVSARTIAGRWAAADLESRYEQTRAFLEQNSHLDEASWLLGQIESVEATFPELSQEKIGRIQDSVNGRGTLLAREILKEQLPEPVSSWKMRTTLLRDNTVINHNPTSKADAKRLLRNARGEADGAIRQVVMEYDVCPDRNPADKVTVIGPKDGRPIVIDLDSGLPRIRVESGKAIIRAASSWGNSVEVAAGAEAIVIADAGTKVSCDAQEGGKLTFMTDSQDNRFHAHGAGEIITKYAQDDSFPAVTAEDILAPCATEDHEERWEEAKRFLRAQPGREARLLHEQALRKDNSAGFTPAADVREGQAGIMEQVRSYAAQR